MCGRYTLTTPGLLGDRFGVMNIRDLGDIEPNYNVAPGFVMPVIIRSKSNEVVIMKWGLIPPWAKDPKIGYKMINARDDTISSKPSFKKPFRSQRCLIPANGFYEWKKTGGGKTPYYIRSATREMIAFAGLYDVWKDAEGQELRSYTIITTSPNSLLKPLHNRMPVILNERDEQDWIDSNTKEAELLKMLNPYESGDMKAEIVSDEVNSPKNNSSKLIIPL